ncbi:hypothetical protein GCM10022239_03660 [Leifsonia bigeumensis]|uniref:ASCH domain-containing protein n=1 Tax=Leifsonella bigeumensis TaxID=433643 RepID=A0ABP7F2P3_9MICO
MRILTVRQPWAWAIIHGGKNVENRPQNLAGDYRGPIAIHAGKEWDLRGGRSGLIWDALSDDFGWPVGAEAARHDPRPGFDAIRPLGAIIGVVNLVGVHRTRENGECRPMGLGWCSRWAEPNAWHLRLADPRPLVEPIPYKGALGLRELPADVVERILAGVTS